MSLNFRLLKFNHIRELHHSQTFYPQFDSQTKFNHIRELHHSQTVYSSTSHLRGFNHIRELHHSQTSERALRDYA